MKECQGVDLRDDVPTKCFRAADIRIRDDNNEYDFWFCWNHLAIYLIMFGPFTGFLQLPPKDGE